MKALFIKTELAFIVYIKLKKSLVLEEKNFASNTKEVCC